MSVFPAYGLGWRPDLPDPRDFTPAHEALSAALGRLGRLKSLPKRVDWRPYGPPIEDRCPRGGGAACACVALLRYFERRATGKNPRLSRAFLQWTARRLLAQVGGGEEELRTTWKAAVRFGIPREEDWPSAGNDPKQEPDAFAYASAIKFPGLAYVRLDDRRRPGEAVLRTVKSFLAAGFASVFGFCVCTGLSAEADIPGPTVFDAVWGGQAAIAVGYDDVRKIRSWRGALLIGSSWGNQWGDGGYGWLPYAYVLDRLALDFWTLVRPEWLASGEFERPFTP
jgi:C1A family cysteine protease